MPIRALLEADKGAFGPEDIVALTTAFDSVLQTLKLTNREDPMVTMVAKFTIEIAKQGERDPKRLSKRVLELVSR